MDTVSLKLVTIIGEPVLEERLTADLRQLGATGHTVIEGHGRGSRGLHAADIPGTIIQIETVVSAEVADRILERVASVYFPHYGVIAYVSTVEVVRGEKYL